MKRHTLVTSIAFASLAFFIAGCETTDSKIGSALLSVLNNDAGGGLSVETVVAGLKEALTAGTEKAVAATSKEGGYLDNSTIHILLPEQLNTMTSALRKIGLGSQVDQLESKMNQSAEMAAKEAAPVFLDAIKSMSFEDAKKILNGSDDAATEYFRKQTSETLKKRYLPIVTEQLEQVGVVSLYKNLEEQYNRLPFVPKTAVTLEDYVTDRALDGLFTVLADEEKRIREDPAAQTTELLKKVFGK